MLRPIRQLGDPCLKAVARPMAPEELTSPGFLELVRDMAETLQDSGGVGLAAPQVGESVRVILAGSFPSPTNPDRPAVPVRLLINPQVVATSEQSEAAWEGCLSFLRYRVRVTRPIAVTVDYLDELGQPARIAAQGFLARVLQHEIDHLDGILTLDRAEGPEDVREEGAPQTG